MTARLLRVLGSLLMLSAVALSLSRAPDRAVETLVARWALPPSSFIDLDGQLVHLRDVGPRDDPLPIVLLHGTSSSLHTWQGWVQGLERQRRVVTLDLPGFGLTGPRSDGQYHPDADAGNGDGWVGVWADWHTYGGLSEVLAALARRAGTEAHYSRSGRIQQDRNRCD